VVSAGSALVLPVAGKAEGVWRCMSHRHTPRQEPAAGMMGKAVVVFTVVHMCGVASSESGTMW